MLATRTDTRGDLFEMSFEGQDEPITKRTDTYDLILKAVTEMRDGPYRDGDRVQIATLGGHPVYVTRTRARRGDNWFRAVQVGFDWPGGSQSYISSEITEGSGRGMLATLERRLEGLEALIESAEKSIATKTEQQEISRSMIGRPFTHEAQLREAQARAKLLDDILKTQAVLDELKDEAKKPAEERSEAYQEAAAELVVLKASLDVARQQVVPDPAAEPDTDITPVIEDPTPTVRTDDDGFAVPDVGEDFAAADDLDAQVSPDADVDQVGTVTPEGTSRAGSPIDPDQPGPEPVTVQDGEAEQQAAADTAQDASVDEPSAVPANVEDEPAEPDTPAPSPAGEETPEDTAPAPDAARETETVEPEDLRPGDRIRFVRTSDGVRRIRTRGGGTRLAQSEGRVWEGTVPANYRPGSAVRLQDVVETEGNQPARYVADPGLVRLTDAVDRLGTDEASTSAAEAVRLRDSRVQAREANRAEQAQRRRQMLEEEGGTGLADAVEQFEAAAARGSGASRREIEDAWLHADAALASAEETATHWARQAQLKTLRSTLRDQLFMAGGREGDARRRAAEWEQAKADADRIADDGTPAPVPAEDLAPGDRVDTPAGDETVVVEEVTHAGDVTFTTERDSQDRRTIRARKDGTQVTKRTGGRKANPPTIDQVQAADVEVGDWLIDDDGTAAKVVTIDRSGDRITFEVDGPTGPSLVDADFGEMVTRGRGLRMKRPRKPRPPRERKPRSTITTLDDGTPATRVRLRSDIRKRVLGLAIEDDANAPEQARLAAARLRGSQPMSAEQMRALGQYLRTLAAQDRPAVQRRSLERAASWVDASYARLAGYPAPPHEAHRDAPEKAYPENLAAGDIIAIPDSAGGEIQPVRVVDVKPTPRMPFVTAVVEHGDGRREQRILAAGVDVWLMPDLPADVEVPPTPDDEFDPEEHIHPDRLEVGDVIRHPMPGGSPFGRVMAIRKTSKPFADVEEWQVDLATLDEQDRPIQQTSVTLSSRGAPSVVRTWRGELSRPQPWDAALDNSTGDGIITPDQVEVGDRIIVTDAAGSTRSGTVTSLMGVYDDDGLQVGQTAFLRGYDGETDLAPLLEGTEIIRQAKGGAGAAERLHAQMEAQAKAARQRAIIRALADAETGLYRQVAATLLGELDTTPLVPARERDGDEVYAQALTRLEEILERQPEGLAEQVADALEPPTDEQHAEIVRTLRPVVAEVRDRAAANLVAAIGEIDPLPGETWDQALRRVMTQYRDMPPSDSLVRAGEALAKADLDGRTDADAPGLPQVREADLPARMAAYRAALPEDLANIGRKQVRRPVFQPTSLADLEAGQVPAADTITTWVDDIADDGGPGEHAMRHLAVLHAAGADLDSIYRARLADADPAGLEAKFGDIEARALALREDAYVADQNLLAAKKRTRSQVAKQFGFSSMRALNTSASYQVKLQAAKAWKEAYADEERERDAALAAYRAASDEVADNLRARREARRQAAIAALSTVRDLGGEGLEYRRDGGLLLDTDRYLQAMRIAEAGYPSDWLALAREQGAVVVEPGAGNYAERGIRGWRPRITLPWESVDQTIPVDGTWEQEETRAAQMVGGNAATRASVHEFGHHMEKIVPGLVAAERAFLWERTSTGPVGARERNPLQQKPNGDEIIHYRDGFDDDYTAREYNDQAFEVFTVGVETLLAGSTYADNDDDHRAFTFGALALLGTSTQGPRRSPLTGVNLSELSEAELRALLAKVWGNPDEVAQVMAALDRLDTKTGDPLAGVELERLDLGSLVSLLGQVDDDYSVARISAAMEAWETSRREQDEEDRAFAERSAHVDQLVAEGMPELEAWAQVHGVSYEEMERDLRDGDRMDGETRDQMARRHYDLWVHNQYLQAVADTKGYLLNPEGVAAGIDEKSLFSGRRDRARKYASEELRRWFDANGWMNFTEFKAQQLGRERDRRAALAGRRAARDFNR